MLRYVLLAVFCVLHVKGIALNTSQGGYHLEIRQKPHLLASYFSIQSDDSYPGVIKKSVFRLRTNYDLSDSHGWQATGIKRVLSLGSVYPWATEIDIYDTQWNYIGMIDGQVVSTAAARFSLYDGSGNLRGIAYLDHSLHSYSLVYPESEAYPIAEFTRHNSPQEPNWWSINVYDPQQIDERILRIFSGMVCDIQLEIDAYHED